jgi:hypothetical protein
MHDPLRGGSVRLTRSIVLCVLLTPLLAMEAATTRVVTNTDDSGAGSLRQTIADAGAGDIINFDPLLIRSTITLTSGELLIDKLLNINIANLPITVSGGHSSRVFHIASTGVAVIRGLTIRDGFAATGGGILNQGSLSLQKSTVTENRSPSGGAGGIRNGGGLGIFSSTISYNVAVNGFGGGIDNVFGATLTMWNTTVSGNVAGTGGGIDNYGAGSTVAAKFCTIAYNRASTTGGGIHGANGDASAVDLEATILYGNGAPTSPECSGTLKSSDYNLIRSPSGCVLTGVETNNTSGDPVLGSLQRNGGDTPTHPLRAGSDAMDRIPSGSCADAMAVDQRGLARPLDGTASGSTNCDIGAYEAQKPILVNSLLDPSEASKCTLRDAITAANTNAIVNGCAAGGTSVDRIQIQVGGRIRLSAGQLNPTRSVLIEGPGLALTVSGERLSRVFEIGDLTGGGQTFGISGMTIAFGRADNGGGVQMYQEISTLAIDRVAFEQNATSSFGGSINVQNAGPTEIEASSFSNTDVENHTASIAVSGAQLTMRRCTVGETRSKFAAIYDVVLQAIPSLRLIGCTISGSEPSGVLVSNGGASLEIQGSVFAGHGQEFNDLGGILVSRGYNVIADGTGPASQTGDVKNAVTNLAGHLFGGGDTKTIAPLPGSAAIDLIPLTDCPGPLDQRGVARPIDGDRNGSAKCDAGAFETPPPIVVNSLLDGSDAGKCTLHDAISAANGNFAVNGCAAGLTDGPDLITFSVNGTIQLTNGLLATQGVAIRGPGASHLTIHGPGTARIFDLGFTGNAPNGDYTLTGLTLENGHGDFGGALLAVLQHTIALSGVTLRNNVATSNGGAFFAQDTTAVQLTRSTFTNPTGSSAGSFVTVANGPGEAENCTIADNSSDVALEILASGSGHTAFLRTRNLTVSGTDAYGIAANAVSGALPADARAEYSGTIVQHPIAWAVGGGTGVSLGYNLASDYTVGGGPGDLQNTNAMLGPLGYHGGETPVFDPKPASPAKDAIPSTLCGPVVDQRGFARPFGTNCDIGAVERRPGGDVNGDGSFNVADVFYLINFLFAGGPPPVGESDMNGDGVVDVADVFYAINALFAGGAAPI